MQWLLALSVAASATMSPCDLATAPEHWHDVVKLRAVYGSFFEGTFLYDPACANADAIFEPACDPVLGVRACTDGLQQIQQKLSQEKLGGRARVVLEGSLEPWDGYGYGHLNGMRYQFRIARVMEVEKFDSREAWPAPGPSSFMTTVEAVRAADFALVTKLARGGEAKDSAPGFSLVGTSSQKGAATDMRKAAPGCADGRMAVQLQRVFPADSMAFVQGSVECTSAESQRNYEYGIVYLLKGREWMPTLGTVTWMR